MRRSISSLVTGVVVGLVLAVAGCTSSTSPAGQPTPGPSSVDPKTELLAAFEALYEQPVSLSLVLGDLMTLTASGDPETGAARMSASVQDGPVPIDMEVVTIPPDMWMNFGELAPVFGLETPWVHIDLNEYAEVMFPFPTSDPKSLMGFSPSMMEAGLVTVRKVDEVTFEGELDAVAMSEFMVGTTLDLSASVPAFPFTAVVDDQGRLVRLSLTIPDMPPGVPDTMEFTYFDFGVPVEISPPPADEVSPMPEELLQMFGTGM